jgi:hypothetical protein
MDIVLKANEALAPDLAALLADSAAAATPWFIMVGECCVT